MTERPMYMELKPKNPIKALRGNKLRCKTWEAEAALRMMENNLDPEVALIPDQLIVYGGAGRACRNWKEYHNIVKALTELEPDETLLIQSGKPVGVVKTHKHSPRVLIANSNIVPAWSTADNFEKYDLMGLTMYGQMTAGSWIYIGTQGILQGTYQTFAAIADKHFSGSLAGTWSVTGGLGGMSGAQPLSVTMNGGVIINVEADYDRTKRKLDEKFIDTMTTDFDEAISSMKKAVAEKKPLSIGLVGNCADVLPRMVKENLIPDIVTDQTSAHDLLDYVPVGDYKQMQELKKTDSKEYKKQSLEAIKLHTQAIIDMQNKGAIAFDYGNNLRGQAELGGLKVRDEKGDFLYPGFVPAYIRPLFCEGRGPYRWAALSGEMSDIERLDELVLEMFPDDEILTRWIKVASKQVPQIGLPNRVAWLGLGDRDRFAIKMNELVKSGELKGPIVIGRDHLDCGSVASPNRETEAMKDGSDAIADWPLLNALTSTAGGADWVSIHNGGGVGIGYSTHTGQVIVATGEDSKVAQLKAVLTNDPMMGVFRHADAGYEEAIEFAKKKNVKIPAMEK